MKNYKVSIAVALCAISTVAYAGAVYLECNEHPHAVERYVSHWDCVEAITKHNREEHGGVNVAVCRIRRR